jgi:hypothetical protein
VVEEFVDEFGVPWACGYGASLEELARFGAYNPQRRSSPQNPAYEVTPTVFLLAPDGRVLWHDDQSRPRHQLTADEWVKQLDEAIERHLQ